MREITPKNRSFVSLISRTGSTVEAVALLSLYVAICGCLVRAGLHFL